ncbi:hypothetical protein ACFX1X_043797 [Malus domestica]
MTNNRCREISTIVRGEAKGQKPKESVEESKSKKEKESEGESESNKEEESAGESKGLIQSQRLERLSQSRKSHKDVGELHKYGELADGVENAHLGFSKGSILENEYCRHKNTSPGDCQTKEHCADVFQYILPYAKASSDGERTLLYLKELRQVEGGVDVLRYTSYWHWCTMISIRVVPFYDQRTVVSVKDAAWTMFCGKSTRHFKKSFCSQARLVKCLLYRKAL